MTGVGSLGGISMIDCREDVKGEREEREVNE